MIENSSSILEILVAFYVTLAFDEVLARFVKGFDVRKNLKDTIMQNLTDSDLYDEDTEKYVEKICNEYVKANSRFAPIFLVFTLIILYLISSVDPSVKSNIIIIYIVGTKLAIAALLIFFIFLFKSNWFTRGIVNFVILFVIVSSILMCFCHKEIFFEQSLFDVNYNEDEQKIVSSFFILLTLSLPILYMIFYSWAYPASCNVFLDKRNKYKNFLNGNIQKSMKDDKNFDYFNTYNFLSAAKKNNILKDYELLLKDKTIWYLYRKSLCYRIKLKNAQRVVQDASEM